MSSKFACRREEGGASREKPLETPVAAVERGAEGAQTGDTVPSRDVGTCEDR